MKELPRALNPPLQTGNRAFDDPEPTTATKDAEELRKKLLQSTQNARFYERKKSRTAPQLSTVGAYPNWGYTASGCFDHLKDDLLAWGFTEDLEAFGKQMDTQWHTAVTLDSPTRQQWIDTQEAWLRQGDLLLRRLTGVFADEEMLGLMSPDGLAEVWSELTGIAYIIMYMLTAIEARLEAGLWSEHSEQNRNTIWIVFEETQ
ncbi:hypothetical protein C8Q80DRAFT_1274753 [Daedaleopsis nitida]|nr:hypothetical protein C8Q80DRAFT_1274753 [Daedaleopsis nitida]